LLARSASRFFRATDNICHFVDNIGNHPGFRQAKRLLLESLT
jgi:hypothetical protein